MTPPPPVPIIVHVSPIPDPHISKDSFESKMRIILHMKLVYTIIYSLCVPCTTREAGFPVSLVRGETRSKCTVHPSTTISFCLRYYHSLGSREQNQSIPNSCSGSISLVGTSSTLPTKSSWRHNGETKKKIDASTIDQEVMEAVRHNLRAGATQIKVMAGGGVASDWFEYWPWV